MLGNQYINGAKNIPNINLNIFGKKSAKLIKPFDNCSILIAIGIFINPNIKPVKPYLITSI